MFKLITVIVSLMIAVSGAVAIFNPKIFNNAINTNLQSSENTSLQNNANSSVQDSSGLFLSANGNSNLNLNTDLQNTLEP